MPQFHIYHAINPTFTEEFKQNRKYVGFVEAEDLEGAYSASQNLINNWNPSQPCRSTSIGDVIQDDEAFYVVSGIGFIELPDGDE